MRVVPVVTWPRQWIVLETEGKEKEKGGKFQMCEKMHLDTVFCREFLREFFYPNVFAVQFWLGCCFQLISCQTPEMAFQWEEYSRDVTFEIYLLDFTLLRYFLGALL